MNKNEYIEWIEEIKEKLPAFLSEMKSENKKGFFRYSYSGDYLNEKFNWGLGNSVFALKIYRSLNLKPENLNDIICFVQNFQKQNGEFYDPYIKHFSFPLRTYNALKERDINRLYHKFVRRAETRQSISALKLFDIKPKYEFSDFPHTENDIKKYIDNLNWDIPWGAGSHFSALMFFLSLSEISNKIKLIDFLSKYILKLRRPDGCWYTGTPSLQLKINGAMKIITGLKAAAEFADINNGKVIFTQVEKLIDTALLAANDINACSNFNITYVLRYANELTGGNYRYEEIENFIKQRLDIYREFYHKKYGAFSFYKNKTNTKYYGAYITKGKKEPDIHGTVMFLWGLAVIGSFWNLNEQTELYEFVT